MSEVEEEMKNVKFDEVSISLDEDDFEFYPNYEVLEDFDMHEKMESDIIRTILLRYLDYAPNYEKVATNIKKEMDEKYGGVWQCIVGTSFGFEASFVQYNLIYLCIEDAVAVALWQAML